MLALRRHLQCRDALALRRHFSADLRYSGKNGKDGNAATPSSCNLGHSGHDDGAKNVEKRQKRQCPSVASNRTPGTVALADPRSRFGGACGGRMQNVEKRQKRQRCVAEVPHARPFRPLALENRQNRQRRGGGLMDPLVTAAHVGTGQRSPTGTPTVPEVDELLSGMADLEPERALLLRAGAWAVYNRAGATAESGVASPAPAPVERLRPCPPAAADLLARILTGPQSQLLPEALARLCRAGLRLPFDLLPAALSIRDAEVRAALVPVIGERGRWLAQHNKAWTWVARAVPEALGQLPEDAETIWAEGDLAQRVAVLRGLRALDPAKARDWLAAVWKREGADARARLLSTFEVGLSPADEPFLEAALDDRGESVRYLAPALLARIPGSALGARMRQRADALLDYAGGTLHVSPPREIDAAAQRDGVRLKPQRGMGERAWWLAQILRLVPLAHWEERFGAAPSDLVAASDRTDWADALVEGWSESAALNGGANWAFPLWLRCKVAAEPRATYAHNLRAALASLLPRDEIEAYAAELVGDAKAADPAERIEAVQAVPAPWSREFADTYLVALRRAIGDRKAAGDYAWPTTLRALVAALPPDLLTCAADACTLPPDADARKHPWGFQLDAILDTIHTRQRLMEVIPL